MYKEIIIIVIVIALVIGLDIVTNNYTKETVEIMSRELNIINEDIYEKNIEEAQLQMEVINDKWNERYNFLAYYIEHDELEKVETQLTALAADLSTEEYTNCITDSNTAIYILKHIQDKEKLKVQSIF